MPMTAYRFHGPADMVYPDIVLEDGVLVAHEGDVRDFESPPPGFWRPVEEENTDVPAGPEPEPVLTEETPEN